MAFMDVSAIEVAGSGVAQFANSEDTEDHCG